MHELDDLSLTDEQRRDIRHRVNLLGSLLLFTRVFYKLRTGREFIVSNPVGEEPHIITACRALTKLFRLESRNLMVNMPPGYGKAIDVKTPILTRTGWATAGDINVGDEIVGSNGWTRVTGVFPQGILAAKEVFFSNGGSVICNDEHLWAVRDRYTAKDKIKTTADIEDTLLEADGRKHWKIPLVKGNYGKVLPTIDPYLLGCWLGDGSSYGAKLTSMDEDIVQAFRDKGHDMVLYENRGKASEYGITGNGFQRWLRLNGQLKNKHIPEEAYRWSKQNRLALLQGLMDTDGTCSKNGSPSFCNKNKNIIKGVCYLVSSLGGTYTLYHFAQKYTTISIRLPDNLLLFRLKRKQERVAKGIKCSPRRFIANILPAKECEMVCFTVDAEDKLFAVGNSLLLTHNSEICKHFVAWCFAHYPDCNFLYVSHGFDLATVHTSGIKDIMMLPEYQRLFEVKIKTDASAKDYFKTEAGGCVAAFGSTGGITGYNSGLPGVTRFSGGTIMDDLHKPDEVHSDTMRGAVWNTYLQTISGRRRSEIVPQLAIGHLLHEDDALSKMIKGDDGEKWERVVIKELSDNGFPRYPEIRGIDFIRNLEECNNYVYHSQHQQNPQPPGGSLFKEEFFVILAEEPNIIATIITCDTAETPDKNNDASVFSFWGIYKIETWGVETDVYALHWIDCEEFRVEIHELEDRFMRFYAKCLQHKVPPQKVCIEKKSSGSTLISLLKKQRGISIVDILRNRTAGNKTARFIEVAPFVAQRLVSLPLRGAHTQDCIRHMTKITRTNTHAHDDIADTLVDAIDITLRQKIIIAGLLKIDKRHHTDINTINRNVSNLRSARYATRL